MYLSTKVKNKILEEIGGAKFCVIVNDSLSIVLKFVNEDGFVQ
jgi:hypothetical protein